MGGCLAVSLVLMHAGHALAEDAEAAFDSAEYQEARLRQSWARVGRERALRAVDKVAQTHVEEFQHAEGSVEPVAGQNGRVIFLFGAQVPRVSCRPLTVCDVELEPGEQVVEFFGGDLQRWMVGVTHSGSGPSRRPHVVVKPSAPGRLETNLVVHTDRRTYHLDLVSPSEQPMRFVSFNYPEAARVRFAQALAEAERKGEVESKSPGAYAIEVEPWKMHRNYSVTLEGRRRVRKRIRWAPASRDVFDDGEKTFIKLPEAILSRERPVLFVETASGEHALVEYQSKGPWLLVSRLFDRAYLVLGSGKKQERVRIEREQ